MRLRDADEAVHDPPYRAEQADEGGGGADGGQHAGAARDAAGAGSLDPFEPRGDALLDAVLFKRGAGKLQLGDSRGDETPDNAARLHQPLQAALGAANAPEPGQVGAHPPLDHDQFQRLGEPHRPGDHRGDNEADQDRLHYDIGIQEHTPGGKVAWQERITDRGDARGSGFLGERGAREQQRYADAKHHRSKGARVRAQGANHSYTDTEFRHFDPPHLTNPRHTIPHERMNVTI